MSYFETDNVTHPPWSWRRSRLRRQTAASRLPPSPSGSSSSRWPQCSPRPWAWWFAGWSPCLLHTTNISVCLNKKKQNTVGRRSLPLYLALDTLLGKDGGGIKAMADVARMRHQSHVRTWATPQDRIGIRSRSFKVKGANQSREIWWSSKTLVRKHFLRRHTQKKTTYKNITQH